VGNTPYVYTAAATEDSKISTTFTAGRDRDNMFTKIPVLRKRANAVSIPEQPPINFILSRTKETSW
jgi:hypothetical protein